MNDLLPLRTRLKKYQAITGMSWEVLEKDYFLSWVLHAITQVPSLSIVFKGGTALKKCYFGEYRFSEDLDFTALRGAPASFDPLRGKPRPSGRGQERGRRSRPLGFC